jgi:hypothetical protein
MAKQVNVSCVHHFQEENTYAWISDFSEDGYRGELVDCIYADDTPNDTTDWCVFAGTEGQCLIFRGLYNIYGKKTAEEYAKRLEEEAYKKFLRNLN